MSQTAAEWTFFFSQWNMPLTSQFYTVNLDPFIFPLEIVTLVIAIIRSSAVLNSLLFFIRLRGKLRGGHKPCVCVSWVRLTVLAKYPKRTVDRLEE